MALASPRVLVILAAVQGAYFVLTGVWGLVHLESFQWVTGPKNDLWLVRTVSVLVLAIGGALLVAAMRLRVAFETAVLAMGSALGLAVIDVVHVAAGTIRWVYLLDAAAEIVLLLGWAFALWRARNDLTLWGSELHNASAAASAPSRAGRRGI